MNILTFDIEDWFHINFDKEFNNEILWNNFESRIEKNTEIILEILSEHNIKATFFCLGWVARKYPSLVRNMDNLGHDVACHSDIHNLVTKQNKEEFDLDLKRSINSIEDAIGKKVNMFRAPAFSIGNKNKWAFEKINENGIEIDCSVFPAKHDFGGFTELNTSSPFKINYNGSFLKEFPMSTYNMFNQSVVLTGGGFFRFFPYFLIKSFMKRSNYNMTYFHPRDFDADQPILENLSKIRKFKSYYGLKYSLNKFKNLLNDFDFISISEADKSINWERQHSIELY